MPGILDSLMGGGKNPYGGLLSDDQWKAYQRQQFFKEISGIGDMLMRAGTRGSGTGAGLLAGMGGVGRGGGGGGLLQMMQMQQYGQAQQDRQEKRQREKRQYGARDMLSSGALASARQPAGGGLYPGRSLLERAKPGLLGQAYPEAVGKAEVAQAYPKAQEHKTATDMAGARRWLTGPQAGERTFPGAEKPPAPQYAGVPKFDPGVGKYYQIHPESKKREYITSPTGMDIEVGPDGTVIRTGVRRGGKGGAQGLTKSNRTYINKQIMAADAALERLDTIRTSWKPEWNTLEKRANLKWAAFKEKVFGEELTPEMRAEVAAFAEGSSNAIMNINLVIHDLTGAQMSVYEAKRLRLPEPDPGEGIWPADSPTEFKAKMDARYKAIEKVRARYRYYTQKGVYDVNEMAGKTPLDSMEVFVNPQTGERIVEIDGNWIPMQ